MNFTAPGVTVTCLCPGATATEFHKRANATSMKPAEIWFDGCGTRLPKMVIAR